MLGVIPPARRPALFRVLAGAMALGFLVGFVYGLVRPTDD